MPGKKRIYISVDFEGAACVVGAAQALETLGTGLNTTTQIFQQAQRIVTAEATAAVRGALAGGAGEVIVDDAHGSGHNLLYEQLHPEAKVLLGAPRPRRFAPLDKSFDGMMFVGYHAMSGVQDGILSHSYSSLGTHLLKLNGKPIGEIGIDAGFAGEFGVPVIFVSSDEAGCAEATAFLGKDVVTVATKKGLSRNCALSLSPAKAQALIEAGAKRAVENSARFKPYRPKGPFVVEKINKWESQADASAREPGAERTDAYTVRHRAKSMLDVIRYV
jgi:D-amino peptidase